MKAEKLIYGVGVNDVDYPVNCLVDGKHERCPYYIRWIGMMRRVYSNSIPSSYVGCSVHPDWYRFSTFKDWMERQDWEGMHLDKDILFAGNRVYSQDTCAFVTRETNAFLIDRKSDRGEFPIGVTKNSGKFRAVISDKGKLVHLGSFSTPEEAHQAWRAAKYDLAMQLASEQTDPRVAAALIERYKL